MNIKDITKMIKDMGLVLINGRMGRFMRDNGKIIKELEQEYFIFLVEVSMKGNLRMVRRMDQVFIITRVERGTKVI